MKEATVTALELLQTRDWWRHRGDLVIYTKSCVKHYHRIFSFGSLYVFFMKVVAVFYFSLIGTWCLVSGSCFLYLLQLIPKDSAEELAYCTEA